MDPQLEKVLCENGLAHLIPRFIELGVADCDTFILIKEEKDLVALCQNLGERLKIKSIIQSLIPLANSNNKPNLDPLLNNTIIVDEKWFEENGFSKSFEFVTEESSTKIVLPTDNAAASNAHSSASVAPPSASCSNLEVPVVNSYCEPPSKKIRTKNLVESVSKMELKDILESSTSGRAILKYYQVHKKLKPQQQSHLARIIIENVVKDSSSSLTSNIISQMADGIIFIFPTECKEAYFLETHNGKRKIISGKLSDRYKNFRQFLRSCENQVVNEMINNNTINYISEDVNEKIMWLQNNISPWNIVCEYWKSTTEYRIAEFHNDSTLQNIVKKWPALKNEKGYNLIQIDFDVRYPPDKTPSIFERWDIIKEKLYTAIREDEKSGILAEYDSYADDDERNCQLLMHLPNLLPSGVIKNKGAPHLRPTKKECQDSFITRVYDISEIHSAIKDRKERYLKYKLTLQPSIFYIEHIDGTKDYYNVITDTLFYKLPTAVSAVASVFQTHQVFNLRYNAECFNAWIFIQRYIYNIKTIYDKRSPSVSQLEKLLSSQE